MRDLLPGPAALLLAVPLRAQSLFQPPKATREAIDKLRFLESSRKGSGWIQTGPQRFTFNQTEAVVVKANGTVVQIDGLGVDSQNPQRIIHKAFAVISYDSDKNRYLMRAFLANGRSADADARVNDDGSFTWAFTHPMAGQIGYTLRSVDGKRVETGRMNRNNEGWKDYFEMTLSRETPR